jgi:hypothetical protein
MMHVTGGVAASREVGMVPTEQLQEVCEVGWKGALRRLVLACCECTLTIGSKHVLSCPATLPSVRCGQQHMSRPYTVCLCLGSEWQHMCSVGCWLAPHV